MAATTAIPRVVTGDKIVDYIIPILTYKLADSLLAWAYQYTDEQFQLLRLAGVLYMLTTMIKYVVEWVAADASSSAQQHLLSPYARVWCYVVDMVRWVLFFMLPSLTMAVLTSILVAGPAPPWYEALALAATILAFILAVLPVMLSSASNVVLVTVTS